MSEPLLAPVPQWGHAPFTLSSMSAHAVSRQARDLLEGTVIVHRSLPVRPAVVEEAPVAVYREVGFPGYTLQQWRVVVERRKTDVAELAGVTDELAAVDQRAAELD